MEEYDGIMAAGLLGQDVDVYDEIVVAGRPNASASRAGEVWWWRYEGGSYTSLAQHVIMPNDTSPGDRFGKAVALSDGVLAVGAPRSDNSGAVYIFDYIPTSDSWTQRQKIDAPFGADDFGEIVDLVGDTLVATANEFAHIYRPTESGFWFKEKSIAPPSGYVGSQYHYVAINSENEEEIVIAQQSNDGTHPALIEIRTRNGGSWSIVQQLFPIGQAFHDQHFGDAVAFAGNYIAVGGRTVDNSSNNDQPGGRDDDPGAVHTYKRQTGGSGALWEDYITLRAHVFNTDGFGEVHNSDVGCPIALTAAGTLIVGAEIETRNENPPARSNGTNSRVAMPYAGAVYVFDLAAGFVKLQTIVPDDSHTHQWFGTAVAVDDAPTSGEFTMAVGVPADDDGCWDDDSQNPGCGAPNQFWSDGSVYIYEADKDEDGIPSRWEIDGGVDVDGDGTLDVVLPNANPLHKNLYVELDSVTGQALMPGAIADVVQAFANAPVMNVDRSTGVTLHIDASETDLPDQAVLGCPAVGDGFCSLQAFKAVAFGKDETRDVLGRVKRYGVVLSAATSQSATALGRGELPGNDFVIFGHNFTASFAVEHPRKTQSAVLMHELGHNLNLRHGGGDDIHAKPNYPSIMNYAVTAPYPHYEDFWVLDYSREQLDMLDESDLDEFAGITVNGGVSQIYQSRVMPAPVNDVIRLVALDGGPIDWDASGTFDVGVVFDVSHGGLNCSGSLCQPSPNQILHGYDDWANLQYVIGRLGNFEDFQTTYVPDEPTVAELESYVAALSPDSLCTADLTDNAGGPPDGTVDTFDLMMLLANWNSHGAGASLAPPNDNVNVYDLFVLLVGWGACEE